MAIRVQIATLLDESARQIPSDVPTGLHEYSANDIILRFCHTELMRTPVRRSIINQENPIVHVYVDICLQMSTFEANQEMM